MQRMKRTTTEYLTETALSPERAIPSFILSGKKKAEVTASVITTDQQVLNLKATLRRIPPYTVIYSAQTPEERIEVVIRNTEHLSDNQLERIKKAVRKKRSVKGGNFLVVVKKNEQVQKVRT